MTKKLLIQFDTDSHTSTFDAVVAFDSGIDHLIPHASITIDAVESLVHGAMFTRGGDQLKNTAIFVGGSKVGEAEAIVKKIEKTFFGPVRVSVMLDANGCNTTAAAAVVCAGKETQLSSSRVVILGATGPVGRRVAQLMASEGATVVATSRSMDRAAEVCESINAMSLPGELTPDAPQDSMTLQSALEGTDIVVACGAAGVQLLDSETLKSATSLKVAIDLNAVPPTGIEGLNVTNKAKLIGNVKTYGAIGVGGLKMKAHRAAIASLFESNDRVLDATEIYEIAKGI